MSYWGDGPEDYQPMPRSALREAALWLALVLMVGATMLWILGLVPMLAAVGCVLLAVGSALVAEEAGRP